MKQPQQCDWVYDNGGDGYLCCQLEANHDGEHEGPYDKARPQDRGTHKWMHRDDWRPSA